MARGEDANWTPVTGKYYDSEARASFVQIAGVVLIMNGVDRLSYYDISSGDIVPFTALATPDTPSIANNGSTDLTGSIFTAYYAVSVNSEVGESIASAAGNFGTTTDRDLWNPTTQSLKITWNAVSNAESYNIYQAQVAPGGAPTLYLIASGLTNLSFVDDGSFPQDTTRPAPTTDSTAGPICSRGAEINGRAFLVGDLNNPYYVRYGGDPGYELDFSPANGGGFTPVSSGSQNLPIAVKSFRDAHGDQQITVLCQGTNGQGKRFFLTPDSLTVGETVIEFFDVTEDSAQDGTDSPDAVVLYSNNLWYPSRDGFKTTGTKPQLQNVLSTDRISNTIQRDIAQLNSAAMGDAGGVGFEGRLYFALPAASDSNNEIWVLDLQRGGAWMKPWDIAADQIWLYNDNEGNSHICVLVDNQISELSYVHLTSDNGVPFNTSGSSGLIKFSPDGRQWGSLIQVVFTLLKAQGIMNFQIAGRTEDSTGLLPLGSVGLIQGAMTNSAGWSESGWSTQGWGNFAYVPVPFGIDTQDVIVETDEEVQYWQYSWNSSGSGVDYNLSAVIAEYVSIGIRDLT